MSYDHGSDRYGLGEPNFETLDTAEVDLKEPNIAHFKDPKTGKEHKVRSSPDPFVSAKSAHILLCVPGSDTDVGGHLTGDLDDDLRRGF